MSVAKGGLVPDHMVMCTKDHIPCGAVLDEVLFYLFRKH